MLTMSASRAAAGNTRWRVERKRHDCGERVWAGGRLEKVVSLVESKEAQCVQLDADMFDVGNDTAKLAVLQTTKSKLEAEVEELMTEWEELEQLVDASADLL